MKMVSTRFLTIGLLTAMIGLAATTPARADWDDHAGLRRAHENHGWREHEWREHEWQEHEWREHHGYYRPIYAPPPYPIFLQPRVVYVAPPPPYGFSFSFYDR